MTKQELIEMVKSYVLQNSGCLPHWANVIGVRYDNQLVSVDQELEHSKDNTDRDDSRDFPQYGSNEYNSLPCVDGTSAYLVADAWDDEDDFEGRGLDEILNGKEESAWDHASIVIGRKSDWCCEDQGEVAIHDCTVVKVLW